MKLSTTEQNTSLPSASLYTSSEACLSSAEQDSTGAAEYLNVSAHLSREALFDLIAQQLLAADSANKTIQNSPQINRTCVCTKTLGTQFVIIKKSSLEKPPFQYGKKFNAAYIGVFQLSRGCTMEWEDYVTNIWTERLVWIRQLIISIMLNLRDVKFVVDRTSRNSFELGQIFGSVYGVEAGQEFEALLKKYREMLQQVSATIKSGENADVLKEQWVSIAEEIADYLNKLNPYWEKSAIQGLIVDELHLEYSFATDLKEERFEQGIASFDAAYDNARRAAQLMIDGTKMYLGPQ